MEENKSGSQSDKDRHMAKRFGGENAPEVLADDDSEDEEKSTDKKDSGKGIFSKREKVEAAAAEAEKEIPKRVSFFEGLLKKEVEADVEPLDKTELNPENQELTDAFQEVVVERIDAVEKELELPQPDDQAEAAVADAAFLGRVGDRLDEGMPPEEAIDDALEDEFEPPEMDALPNDLEQVQNFNIEDELEDDLNQPVVPLQAAGSGVQNSPPQGTSTPNIPQNPNIPTNNSNIVQPNLNVVPNAPYNPNILYPISGNLLSSSPNVQSSPNVVDDDEIKKMNDYYYRKGRSGGLLLGGIAGYMLGRRGGRKRAEARLEPQIEKKDKELDALSIKLQEKEAEVRKLALDKASTTLGIERQTQVEKPSPTVDKTAQTLVENLGRNTLSDKIPKFEKDKIAETVTEELKIIEAQEKRFEKELSKANFNEVIVEKSKPIEARPSVIEEKKDVRTMTMSELLEVAERVMLEKTSLRELYERQRIDAVNLRRVIIEYMNGGTRYEKVLRGSLEAVEMQRELRNEIKRDDPFSSSDGASSQSSTQSVTSIDSSEKSLVSRHDEVLQNNNNTLIEEQGIVISNSTAIVLGVVTGIIIMILLFFYISSN